MVTARFAPSPTGFLHVGNIRTALLNYLACRKHGGTFILRLDDTDRERCRPEFVDAIKEDLEWLGLRWDRVERQSDRRDRYDAAVERLREAGLVYDCYETEDELKSKRQLQRKSGLPPKYDRASLRLTDDERRRLQSERRSYYRFMLDDERVEWVDGVQGPVSVSAGSLSDPVLVRADGRVLYTLSSVVDDVEMGISDVVRGSDHLTNTAMQIQLMRKLGAEPPRFAHHSLLTGQDGGPLAKRLGALSIREMRSQGIEPILLLSMLAYLGTSKSVKIRASLEELGEDFEIGHFSPVPTRFSEADLAALNSKHLAALPFESVEGRVADMGIPGAVAERFWLAVRGNVSRVEDAVMWWDICRGRFEPDIDDGDREFVDAAMALLPIPPFGDRTWADWTEKVSRTTGRRGRGLYMPLRKALTGRSNGPEMAKIMPFLRSGVGTGG